ncbi:MAG: hypothetical protein AAB701_01470 [Patescibacteria group bacterium]
MNQKLGIRISDVFLGLSFLLLLYALEYFTVPLFFYLQRDPNDGIGGVISEVITMFVIIVVTDVVAVVVGLALAPKRGKGFLIGVLSVIAVTIAFLAWIILLFNS